MVAKPKTVAEQGELEAKAAAAQEALAAAIGGSALIAQEPTNLESCTAYTAQDGSKISDDARYLSILKEWRNVAEVLAQVYKSEEKNGPIAAQTIAALRRTIIIPGGAAGPDKADYFGDSYMWKTYVAPMLKQEMIAVHGPIIGPKVWNKATNYWHGKDLTVLAGLVDDAIAAGTIPEDDVAAYQAVLQKNGGNLGQARDKSVEEIPTSVVDLVNSAIDHSAQKRDGWKLEKKVRQSREQKIAADPAKAVGDAVEMLNLAATVQDAGDGPKLAPLATQDGYFRGESALLRSVVTGPDGKPRKGGIKEKPKFKASVEQLRDALSGYLMYEDGQMEYTTFLELLYSHDTAAKS